MRLTTLKPRIATLDTRRVRTVVASDSWRAGKTTAERGYGSKWQQARARHLSANPLCVMCMAEQRAEIATVVDHIEPHRGDMRLFWDEANWQSLCAMHHSSHKQRQENTEK